MIAISILIATVLLAAIIGLRYYSSAFRARMELPKYRFQANLGIPPQQENEDVKR